MNFNSKKCELCSSSSLTFKSIYGPKSYWSGDIKKVSKYNFKICKNCSFTKNLNYEAINFSKNNYDNFTISTSIDFREKILAETIINYAKELNFKKDNLTIIEFGTGFRLGLLEELIKSLPFAKFFAVDSIFENKDLSHKNINFLNSINSLETSGENTIFIARNSLEYLNIQEIKNLFKKIFKDKGLFCAELTNLKIEKMGSSFFYTECSSFYSDKSLEIIFESIDLKMDNLTKNFLYGDIREIILSNIFKKSKFDNILYFDDINSLFKFCEKKKKSNNFVLWGLGGRNISLILNEFNYLVNRIVDSDKKRVGLNIQNNWKVEDVSKVLKDDIIICMNTRFIHSIRERYKKNLVVTIKN